MKEQILNSNTLFKGRIVTLERNLVLLPDHSLAFREIVKHQEGVCIIPIIDNQILFVKQYRSGSEKIFLELPAGLVDENEKPIDAAGRELLEETGYYSTNFSYFGEYYSSPGFCNEKVSIFLAKDLKKGKQSLDNDEFLEVISFPIDKAFKLLDNFTITDMKTALALSILRNKNINH